MPLLFRFSYKFFDLLVHINYMNNLNRLRLNINIFKFEVIPTSYILNNLIINYKHL